MSKNRSPNFPSVDLGEAVDLARKIWDHAQRHPVPVQTVFQKLWGYSAASSGAKQRLAAVRAFGLVEVSGTTEKKQVRVVNAAGKVFAGHPEGPVILRDCALMPRVHQTVWNHFGDEGLPPDETIKHYLMFDFDPSFTDDAARRFITEFKRTVEYAGLSTLENGESETSWVGKTEEEKASEDGSSEVSRSDKTEKRKSIVDSNRRQDVFSVDEGEIVIEWPIMLSAESIEDVEGWLDIIKRKMKRAAKRIDSEES